LRNDRRLADILFNFPLQQHPLLNPHTTFSNSSNRLAVLNCDFLIDLLLVIAVDVSWHRKQYLAIKIEGWQLTLPTHQKQKIDCAKPFFSAKYILYTKPFYYPKPT
jgi:hypothetical protein